MRFKQALAAIETPNAWTEYAAQVSSPPSPADLLTPAAADLLTPDEVDFLAGTITTGTLHINGSAVA
jgi:hypothetical protein